MPINWPEVTAKLPSGRSDEEKANRKELFKRFDPNGNGYLSLAEVDKGVRDVLGLDEVFNCKPAVMRAFQASKGIQPTIRSPSGLSLNASIRPSLFVTHKMCLTAFTETMHLVFSLRIYSDRCAYKRPCRDALAKGVSLF
jgi:hypothetical protein